MVDYTIIIGLVIAVMFSGCGKDDELQLKKMNYSGNELRIDGYFYRSDLSVVPTNVSSYFLYGNGIIYYVGTQEEDKFWSIEYQNSLSTKSQSAKNNKYHWGVFQIGSGEIDFERWYPSEKPYKTYLRSGVILNDSTFHITSVRDNDGGNKRDKDEIYHFKQFSPKPDSTNSFIP